MYFVGFRKHEKGEDVDDRRSHERAGQGDDESNVFENESDAGDESERYGNDTPFAEGSEEFFVELSEPVFGTGVGEGIGEEDGEAKHKSGDGRQNVRRSVVVEDETGRGASEGAEAGGHDG